MIEYRTLKTPDDEAVALVTMQDFMGLLAEYWHKNGKSVYGKPLALEAQQFAHAWTYGSIIIMMAYEDGKPVGFLMGVMNRAITHDSKMLQIEKWYGKTPEIERGLLNHLYSRLNDLQRTEVVVPEIDGTIFEPLPNFSEERVFKLHYYRWK